MQEVGEYMPRVTFGVPGLHYTDTKKQWFYRCVCIWCSTTGRCARGKGTRTRWWYVYERKVRTRFEPLDGDLRYIAAL